MPTYNTPRWYCSAKGRRSEPSAGTAVAGTGIGVRTVLPTVGTTVAGSRYT